MTNQARGRRSDALLLAVGCLNVDVLAAVPALPVRDDRIMSAPFERRAGGMAANVASAAAGLGEPWVVDAKLVAPIGADEHSVWLEAGLEARGVDTRWLDRATSTHATTCLILIEPQGQRAIVSEPSRLSYEQVGRCLRDEQDDRRPRLVHVDGFHAPGARDHVVEAAERGWRSSLDLDELPGEYLVEARLLRFAAAFDTVFVNRARACAVLGERVVAEWVDAMTRWSASTGTVFLLTLGAEGAIVIQPHDAPVRLQPPRVDSIDTTGAGDVFAGVYLSCWLNGLGVVESARKACIAGALATTQRGAVDAAPAAAAIEALAARGTG